jgi:hypothetical protein
MAGRIGRRFRARARVSSVPSRLLVSVAVVTVGGSIGGGTRAVEAASPIGMSAPGAANHVIGVAPASVRANALTRAREGLVGALSERLAGDWLPARWQAPHAVLELPSFDAIDLLSAMGSLDAPTPALPAASAVATAAEPSGASLAGDAGAVDAGPTACPPEMVLVDGDSCADVTHRCLKFVPDDPAHRCLEYDPHGDVCVPPITHKRYCMDRYEWPGTPGAKPQVLVSYYEAENACRSVGKRMCEEDEFYLACEGPQHWPYAWGHERHPSACNIDRPYFLVDWDKWSHGGALEEARRLDQALPIGASQCWSPYGVHDIAGNVDEWTHAREGREFTGSLNGGYWGPVQNACRYVTTVHGPEFSFYQIGFRCCSGAK